MTTLNVQQRQRAARDRLRAFGREDDVLYRGSRVCVCTHRSFIHDRAGEGHCVGFITVHDDPTAIGDMPVSCPCGEFREAI